MIDAAVATSKSSLKWVIHSVPLVTSMAVTAFALNPASAQPSSEISIVCYNFDRNTSSLSITDVFTASANQENGSKVRHSIALLFRDFVKSRGQDPYYGQCDYRFSAQEVKALWISTREGYSKDGYPVYDFPGWQPGRPYVGKSPATGVARPLPPKTRDNRESLIVRMPDEAPRTVKVAPRPTSKPTVAAKPVPKRKKGSVCLAEGKGKYCANAR